MKKLFSILSLCVLATLASYGQRTILATDSNGQFQAGTVASNAFPRGLIYGVRSIPYVFDSDAQAYIDRVPITDPIQALKIHQFVAGIKSLGLCTNVALMADFLNNAGTGTQAYSIAGNDIFLQAGVTWSTNGLEFSGSSGVYAIVTNNFGSTLSAYTIIAAFKCGNTSQANSVISGNGDSAYGPALLVHGSERQSNQVAPGWIYHDWGTAATTDAGAVNYAGRVAKDRSATGFNQIAFVTKSASLFSAQGGMERVWQYSTNSMADAYNGSATWRLGSDLDGNNRLTGSIAFVAVIKQQLTQSQIHNFRRLYQATIGSSYLPRINVIGEGDSLTAGAGGFDGWMANLQTNAVWGPVMNKRIIATGGEVTSQMLSQVPTQGGIFRHEWRNADKTWVILWGGANDVNATAPATTLANLQSISSAYRGYGWKVGVCTIIPSAGHNGTGETNRTALNTLIKAATSSFDAIIDLAAVTELQTTSNTNYFQGDGIHLTPSGQDKVAAKIVATIPTP